MYREEGGTGRLSPAAAMCYVHHDLLPVRSGGRHRRHHLRGGTGGRTGATLLVWVALATVVLGTLRRHVRRRRLLATAVAAISLVALTSCGVVWLGQYRLHVPVDAPGNRRGTGDRNPVAAVPLLVSPPAAGGGAGVENAPGAPGTTTTTEATEAAVAVPSPPIQVEATDAHPAYVLYRLGRRSGAPGPEGSEGPNGAGGTVLPRPHVAPAAQEPLAPVAPQVPAASTAVLVLHGMDDNGVALATTVLPYLGGPAAQDWVVIAPTIPYGDWRTPARVAQEDLQLLPRLARLLDQAPAETGVALPERVLVFGFSRGAQVALRFALLFPERTQAVAAAAAGTYTLPLPAVRTATGRTLPAPLPFGVADLPQRAGRTVDVAQLGQVPVWLGVGANDNRDADVPREWDPFIGANRVQRAQRFGAILAQLGVPVQVVVVPGAAHQLTEALLAPAMEYLLGR